MQFPQSFDTPNSLIAHLKQKPTGNRRGVMHTGRRTGVNQERFGAKSREVVSKTPFFLTSYVGSDLNIGNQPSQRKNCGRKENKNKGRMR
jgi:hypothetical protein